MTESNDFRTFADLDGITGDMMTRAFIGRLISSDYGLFNGFFDFTSFDIGLSAFRVDIAYRR